MCYVGLMQYISLSFTGVNKKSLAKFTNHVLLAKYVSDFIFSYFYLCLTHLNSLLHTVEPFLLKRPKKREKKNKEKKPNSDLHKSGIYLPPIIKELHQGQA